MSQQNQQLLLPIIDLSPFFETCNKSMDGKITCSKEIYSAFSKFGGCYITGFENQVETIFPPKTSTNGENNYELSSIHQSCKELFSLNDKNKKQIPVIQPGGFTRGYIPVGGESGSYKFEKKEAFSYGQDRNVIENPPENPLQGENSWPPEEILRNSNLNKNWKNTLVQFYEEICDISEAVVSAVSLSLGYEENYLGEFCRESRSISLMRLFHYLGLTEDEKNQEIDIIGSSEHTDWGFLTLILQPMSADNDTSDGLQFFYEGLWYDIPAIPNTLVLNCGDYVSLFTNSNFKSPLHRVMSSNADRISMVLFLYPSFDSKIPFVENREHDHINGCQTQHIKLSLFQDQKNTQETNGRLKTGDDKLENIPFGQYILKKWDQVFRT